MSHTFLLSSHTALEHGLLETSHLLLHHYYVLHPGDTTARLWMLSLMHILLHLMLWMRGVFPDCLSISISANFSLLPLTWWWVQDLFKGVWYGSWQGGEGSCGGGTPCWSDTTIWLAGSAYNLCSSLANRISLDRWYSGSSWLLWNQLLWKGMFSLLSSMLGLHGYYVSLPCLLFLSFISCFAHTPLMFTTFSPSQPLYWVTLQDNGIQHSTVKFWLHAVCKVEVDKQISLFGWDW